MGYLTWLQRTDGTKKILRANSELQLKKLRSAECQKLLGEKLKVGPIVKDGNDFTFHMGWMVKPKRVKE